MDNPDGTVSLDVVPNLDQATGDVVDWGKKLKPVTVPLVVDTSKAAAQVKGFAPADGARGFAVSKQSTSFAPSGGAGPGAAVADYTKAAAQVEQATTRVSTSFATVDTGTKQLGSSVRGLGSEFGGAVSQLAPLTGGLDSLVSGLGNAAAGGLAAGALVEVAIAGFTSAYQQLQTQTKESIDALRPGANEIRAAFDPTNPRKFTFEMERLKALFTGRDSVGDFNALDKLLPGSDDWGNRMDLAKAAVEDLQQALDSMSSENGKRALNALKPTLIELEAQGVIAAGTVDELYKKIDERDAIARAEGDLKSLGNEVDRFGFKIDNAKSQLEQYADSIGRAFSPETSALDASAAVAKGQERVAKARSDLAKIESGSSDALTAARQSLVAADRDLTRAIEDNAQAQLDAANKVADAQDRLAAAREKGAALGSGGKEVPGIDRSVSRAIGAAERDLAKAQKDLEDTKRGSDAITSAKERQAAAQKKVNDEEAKVGPNSDAAKKAQQELNDAEAAMIPLLVAQEQAEQRLLDYARQHPDAVQKSIEKVQQWVREGLIAADVADQWLKKLQLIAGEAATTNTGIDPKTGEHLANRPTGNPSTKPKKATPITEADGEKYGLYTAISNGETVDGVEQEDKLGRTWRWNKKTKRWVPQFDKGGLVGSAGGEVHPGEVVMNRDAVRQHGADNLLAMNAGAGGFVQLAQLLVQQNDLLRQAILRPANVIANIDASGSTGMDYAGMSRALADAGFKK